MPRSHRTRADRRFVDAGKCRERTFGATTTDVAWCTGLAAIRVSRHASNRRGPDDADLAEVWTTDIAAQIVALPFLSVPRSVLGVGGSLVDGDGADRQVPDETRSLVIAPEETRTEVVRPLGHDRNVGGRSTMRKG